MQSDLQMMTIEAIQMNKRAMMCKCYDKSPFANAVYVERLFFIICDPEA